jgi:hypothetical protein
VNSLPHRDPAAVEDAVRALKSFGGDKLTAHQAMTLLDYWAGRPRLVGGQWKEVIRRFPGAPIQEATSEPGR